MNYKFLGPIAYSKRDIINVLINDKKQPFYRSSGRNSGKPGVWFPFDGISYLIKTWFAKDQYALKWFDPLHRYGTQEYKDISDWLGTLNIPTGKDISDAKEINLWLDNQYTKQFNENLTIMESYVKNLDK